MGERVLSRRRFTLRDAAILIASMAVGVWLGRIYLLNEQAVFRPMGVDRGWWSWAQAAWLMLISVQFGLLGLSLLPPRPQLPRLARQLGFLAGVAVASAVALDAVQAGANFKSYTANGTYPFAIWLHNELIAISSPHHLAQVILLAWVIVGLQGGWRRSHDWVESSARILGVVWIVAWCAYMAINNYA
jgi:hypothetical protein